MREGAGEYLVVLASGAKKEASESSPTFSRRPSTLVVPAEQLCDADNVKHTQKPPKIPQNPLLARSTQRGKGRSPGGVGLPKLPQTPPITSVHLPTDTLL